MSRIFNTQTKLYAVIGSPVKHSKSPWLFNQIFHHLNLNAVYLAFEHTEVKELITAIRTLDLKGLSITVPHKEVVLPYLDEISPLVTKLKCCNTIINRDGKLIGENTDGLGAIEAIENHEVKIGQTKGSWMKKSITFLGAGGAARGISLSMQNEIVKANLTQNEAGEINLMARSPEKAKSLQTDLKDVSCKLIDWKDINPEKELSTDIIINTTTLGMTKTDQPENISASPLTQRQIPSSATVFDIVYTPLETSLLKLAHENGSSTIDGLDMFLSQANHQLFHWTGDKLPLELLRKFFFNEENSIKQD